MPLKGIPRILSPELLKVLAEMGHGDELVIADCNFPATSVAEAQPHKRLINMDGHGGCDVLKAIMHLFPLDQYVPLPAAIMKRVACDEESNLAVPIWDDYRAILQQAENKQINIEQVERFAFYERAKKAFAVVATGEQAQYANIIIKKGCITKHQLTI